MTITHLPYQVDSSNRFHHYENLWKRVGVDLLAKHCPSRDKLVLDYGCGRGEALELARQRGFTVRGTDTDPVCVELGSRYGECSLLNPQDPLAQFGAKSFDAVLCFHVLEHVDCPRKVLSSLAQIAREYVVLAVPNLRQLRLLFARRINRELVNEGHLQSWDHYHLLNLAERHCGLRLIEWGFDATILAGASELLLKVLGMKAVMRLETGLFKRLFPFHGLSVLGLFEPRERARSK